MRDIQSGSRNSHSPHATFVRGIKGRSSSNSRIIMDKTAHLTKMIPAIIATLALMWTAEGKPGHTLEYCNTEVFRGECAEGEVLMMTSARYGRMKISRCVEIDLGYLGCQKDVMAIADKRCSGRRVCEIRVPDKEMESTKPCLKELKSYLETSYKCVRVETVTTEYCELHDEMNVTSPHGFIASTMTTDTPSCTGSNHPWVIYSQPGQQINLTLHDYAVEDPNARARYKSEEVAPQICNEYGIVEDVVKPHTAMICGGESRLSRIYLSEGHIVKIYVTQNSHLSGIRAYVIEYNVIGCPDPVIPENAWFQRTTDGAEMGCHYSDKKWVLECRGHSWSGPISNCTMPRAEERDDIIPADMPFSYGIAIAIIVGAAFGIALVIFIVGLIRYYSRRRRRDRHNHNHNHTCSRETILLRKAEDGEKPTPVHIPRLVEEHKLPPPETVTFCRHQRHPVRINGNEYEHIWESPLPFPAGTATLSADVHCTLHHHHHGPQTKRMEPLYTTFKVDNRARDKTMCAAQPCYVTSREVAPHPASPRAGQQQQQQQQLANYRPDCNHTDSRYSTLERANRMTNGPPNGTT